MKNQESESQRARPTDIAAIVKDQQRSGLSVAAYSKKHGISAWRIYQAARGATKKSPEFVEVTQRSETDAGAAPEIVLPDGRRISVPRDFDAATLLRLLEIMSPC